MISVEEALTRILSYVDVLPPEDKPLVEALGQVLDEDITAGFNIPPLDNTAMDGYAVRAADTAGAAPTSQSTSALSARSPQGTSIPGRLHRERRSG